MVQGLQLDLMILRVFSNLRDSMTLRAAGRIAWWEQLHSLETIPSVKSSWGATM